MPSGEMDSKYRACAVLPVQLKLNKLKYRHPTYQGRAEKNQIDSFMLNLFNIWLEGQLKAVWALPEIKHHSSELCRNLVTLLANFLSAYGKAPIAESPFFRSVPKKPGNSSSFHPDWRTTYAIFELPSRVLTPV
jgi:hypothetical protein